MTRETLAGGPAALSRRRLGGLLAAGAAWSLARSAAKAANTQVGALMFTQTEIPFTIAQLGEPLKAGAKMTEQVLNRSKVPEVKAYRDFLDATKRKALPPEGDLDAVETWVNGHVRTVSDYELYMRDDVWAPPINTLTLGGDCEDISLVKRWGLVRLGFAPKDLFLVVGLSTLQRPPAPHAVLGVRLNPTTYRTLDSLESRVTDAADTSHFQPAYAVNEFGFWKVDQPGRDDGDHVRRAFERANAKQAGKS